MQSQFLLAKKPHSREKAPLEVCIFFFMSILLTVPMLVIATYKHWAFHFGVTHLSATSLVDVCTIGPSPALARPLGAVYWRFVAAQWP